MKLYHEIERIVHTAFAQLPECHANQYVMIDGDSGEILLAKNAFEPAYPASTTKVLTCMLALNKLSDLDQVISFPKVIDYGSLAGIGTGEKVKIIDLLYGLMLPSGNDAAEALALLSCGSITKFSEEMTKVAIDLGCSEHTNFVNPHGVFNPKHTSTAYDMALIARVAMNNPTFRKIVSTGAYTFHSDKKEYTVENTNALVHQKKGFTNRTYAYATGVKTGQTSKGYSLISSASRDGRNLIQVYLNSTADFGTNQGWLHRFLDSKALFEFCFNHYELLRQRMIVIE